MNYREYAPSGPTSRFIKCYWFLKDDSPTPAIQRIVPDGRPELIFNLGQPFESQKDGKWSRQPESFFAGQITGPLLIRPGGPARMFGMRFHPHGARQLLGLPIRELTDSVIALGDLSQALLRQLERLHDLRSLAQQILALDQTMQLFAQQPAEPRVSHAVQEFECTGGLMSVSTVANQVGLSSRQLERLFRDAVGIPPKLFCRMQRFQGVFRAIESNSPEWVNVAVDCGYYDQAHLIHDFREFSGKTPASLLTRELDIATHFLQSPQMSHFSNTGKTNFL